MRHSSPATRALVAVACLLGLADAQNNFGTVQAEVAQCGTEDFVYLNCYTATVDTLETLFPFRSEVVLPPTTAYPGPGFNFPDPSFPGFSFGQNIYHDSITPLHRARVCRSYGFRFSVVGRTNASQAPACQQFSSTYLAMPRPTPCSCVGGGATATPVTTTTESETVASVTTETSQCHYTSVVAGTTVPSQATNTFTTTFITTLSAITETT